MHWWEMGGEGLAGSLERKLPVLCPTQTPLSSILCLQDEVVEPGNAGKEKSQHAGHDERRVRGFVGEERAEEKSRLTNTWHHH